MKFKFYIKKQRYWSGQNIILKWSIGSNVMKVEKSVMKASCTYLSQYRNINQLSTIHGGTKFERESLTQLFPLTFSRKRESASSMF